MKTNTRSISPVYVKASRSIGVCLVLLISFASGAYAQFCVGIGYGSERLRPDIMRKWAPNFDVQYIASNMRVVSFLDFTVFGDQMNTSTSFVNDQGTVIPYNENHKSTYVLAHLGVKGLFSGDADKKTPNFFAGGGLVDCISFNRYSAKGTDPDHPVSSESKIVNNAFGIGIFAGVQYYLRPVILQLKGDLDFLPKEITVYYGTAPLHSNTRLTIVIPLKQL